MRAWGPNPGVDPPGVGATVRAAVPVGSVGAEVGSARVEEGQVAAAATASAVKGEAAGATDAAEAAVVEGMASVAVAAVREGVAVPATAGEEAV